MKTALLPWLFLLFPLAFTLFWMAIAGIIALCGWRTLLPFQTTTKPTGRVFPFASLEINGAQYKGALTIVVAPEGLWMHPIFLFRAFHPPLLIPWNAFGPPKERKVWWTMQWEFPVTAARRRKTLLVIHTASLREAIAQNLTRPTPRAALDSQDSPFD